LEFAPDFINNDPSLLSERKVAFKVKLLSVVASFRKLKDVVVSADDTKLVHLVSIYIYGSASVAAVILMFLPPIMVAKRKISWQSLRTWWGKFDVLEP
jgi:hypothetical protein